MQAARLRSWLLLHRNRPCNFDNGLKIQNFNTQILWEALSLSHLISYSPENHGHRFLGRKNAEGFANIKSPFTARPPASKNSFIAEVMRWGWLWRIAFAPNLQMLGGFPEDSCGGYGDRRKVRQCPSQVSTCGRERKVREGCPILLNGKQKIIISRWEMYYNFPLL